MDRRNFMKTAGTLIAGASLSGNSLGEHVSEPQAANEGGRLVLPINRGWRFSPTAPDGAHAKEFDDANFERVVVPHTNVSLPWHSFDDKEYEFVSTYGRRFKLPTEARGKRVFVDFEG